MGVAENSISARIAIELGLKGKEQLVEMLVKNYQDEINLRELIEGSGNKPMIGLIQFRLHKIKEEAISQKQFINAYALDKKSALMNLFQHPIENWHINRLDKKLVDKELTLVDLYDSFQERHANLGLLLH